MSLSGLDSPAVEAATRTVSQERGGWFLIHYTSRDEVDVLATGTKGVAELRDAAERYYNGDEDGETKGPLFGMIDFRRRKVLIKLVPDDTSRLVKARVQVHWGSVTSRFPNNESELELTSTDQLTEANVTAHIELHSGRSSSGSNKKPALDGISEEGAEDKVSPLVSGKSSFMARTEDVIGDQQISPLSSVDASLDHSKRISALINKTNATSAALQESITNPASKDLSPVPEVSVTSTSPALDAPSDWQLDRRPSTDARSMLETSTRRLSTQSGRPSTSGDSLSLYDLESLYKPKVKLGPRPATATRPSSKTSNSAALPSGLRASRPPSLRPKSRDSTHSTYSAYRAPPPPPIPETSPLDFVQRPRSSGQSVKSLPATLPKSPGMTREKQRLMKFREMYKEKENKRAKDKAKAIEEASSESAAGKVDSPNPQIEVDEVPEMSACYSPTEDMFPRLSIISEASSSTKQAAAAAPIDGSKEEQSDKTGMTPSSSRQEGVLSAQNNGEAPDEPRNSSEDSSALPASSPTSFMDSSEMTNSTRATSVSDESDMENSKDEVDARRKTIVETPCQPSEDDEDSQSSTPTAAPITTEKHKTADEKEKRRAAVAPLTIPSDHHDHISETESLAHDEDLMDELDGAEVQEAFSVSVTKSPITPFFQRRPSSAHTINSPASFALSDKTTPPPLPSPLPSSIERSAPGSPAAEAAVRAIHITRTMSGSMLKDELPGGEEQKEDTPKDAKERIVAVTATTDASEARPSQIHQDSGKAPEIWRTSAEPVEPNSPPKTHPPRKSSLIIDNKLVRRRSSRRSSASKRLGAKDKSPPRASNPSTSRKSSATLLNPTSDDALSVHKRRNLGTGVAAKIADLQRNFSRGSAPTSPSAQPTSRKSSMVSVRAGELQDAGDRTPPRSAHSHFRDEHLFRGRAMSKGSMRSLGSQDTRTSTPPRNKSSGSVGRLDSKRFTNFNNPALEVSSKPDTIQVKATIIRTDMDRDVTGLGLQDTAVEGEHAKVIPEPHYAQPRTSVIVEEPRSPTRTSMDIGMHRRARSSISSALGMIGIRSSSPQRSSNHPESPVISDGRRSARTSIDMTGSLRALRRRASSSLSRSPSVSRGEASVRSPSHQGRFSPLPPTPKTMGSTHSAPQFGRSMSSSSLESSATNEYDGESHKHKRKGSRASRMLKRMSNSMSSMMHSGGTGPEKSAAHQNNAVPTVEEEKWVGADLGEMNVQFPDTLLWKRRHLEIDTAGYLVLIQPQETSKSKARGTDKLERRYHLSQFFPPFAPDMERMEMPYSVVLDFREEGGTLQVAADSGLGQSGILRVLSEAHRVCSY